jgi:hypothetical protein
LIFFFSFWKVSSRVCIILVVSIMSLALAEHCFMRLDKFAYRSSCYNTFPINILNRVADSVCPCLTSETILNSFVNWLPIFTFAIGLVRVSLISFIIFFGTSYLIRYSIILFFPSIYLSKLLRLFSCVESQTDIHDEDNSFSQLH